MAALLNELNRNWFLFFFFLSPDGAAGRVLLEMVQMIRRASDPPAERLKQTLVESSLLKEPQQTRLRLFPPSQSAPGQRC